MPTVPEAASGAKGWVQSDSGCLPYLKTTDRCAAVTDPDENGLNSSVFEVCQSFVRRFGCD